jgi:hypothetical protein
LSYRQAAELTWGQLIHAMGVLPNVATDEDIREKVRAAQDKVFRMIAAARRCLVRDLLRVPADDLIGLVAAETRAKPPSIAVISENLRRCTAD